MVRNTLESKPLAPLTLSHVSILCVTYGSRGLPGLSFLLLGPKAVIPPCGRRDSIMKLIIASIIC